MDSIEQKFSFREIASEIHRHNPEVSYMEALLKLGDVLCKGEFPVGDGGIVALRYVEGPRFSERTCERRFTTDDLRQLADIAQKPIRWGYAPYDHLLNIMIPASAIRKYCKRWGYNLPEGYTVPIKTEEYLKAETIVRPQANDAAVRDWFVNERIPRYGNVNTSKSEADDWAACKEKFGLGARLNILRKIRTECLHDAKIKNKRGRRRKNP